MFSALVAVSAAISPAQLPYATKDLIFQSADAIKEACATFETSASADLDRFVELSNRGEYAKAYQLWSDLQFRFYSFKLELGQTLGRSESEEVKSAVTAQGELLNKTFQKTLLEHPALMATFLHNAKAASRLSPEQRFLTESILKESEKSGVADALQSLSALKREPFTYVQGEAKPLNSDFLTELKVLTANILCFPGELPYMYGGASPWKERIDRLTKTICSSGAHIVCLQEVWDPEAMRALAARLSPSYACFVYNAGDPSGTLQVAKMGYNSGLFLASKLPLEEIAFQRFPRSIPEGSNRGVIIATCRVAQERIALLNTHLQYASAPQIMRDIRKEQMLLCYGYLQEVVSRNLNSWGFLAGDLNINAFSPEFEECGLPRLFSIPYTAHLSEVRAHQKETATCTDYFNDLVAKPLDQRAQVIPSYELLDYCIQPTLSQVAKKPTQTLIPLYSIEAPTEALSDHQGLLTTWPIAPREKSLQQISNR